MDKRIYVSGQMVRVARDSLSGPPTDDAFVVVCCYRTSNVVLYHVRGQVVRDERLVPASELTPAMPAAFDRIRQPTKVVRLFPDIVPFDRGAAI